MLDEIPLNFDLFNTPLVIKLCFYTQNNFGGENFDQKHDFLGFYFDFQIKFMKNGFQNEYIFQFSYYIILKNNDYLMKIFLGNSTPFDI